MEFKTYYIKNDVFKQDREAVNIVVKGAAPIAQDVNLLDLLRDNKKDIVEKRFGHISSFNFSRDVFNTAKWSDLCKIARGLFMDTEDGTIVARGFDKFFNYEERDFNRASWLQNNLAFPVAAYSKYNGFLGILSFDKKEKKFLFCTKSVLDGEYSQYFKDIFYRAHKDESQDYFQALASHLVETNTCLVFEVVDPKHDPHIVEYKDEKVVLLDQIYLEKNFRHVSYEELQVTGELFKFDVKAKLNKTFDTWAELFDFIKSMESYKDTEGIEGYVFEDSNGYHFKLKGEWYLFWKKMRHYKQQLAAGHLFSTSGLTTPLANDVYGFMKKLGRDELERMSIIDVRNAFLKETSC